LKLWFEVVVDVENRRNGVGREYGGWELAREGASVMKVENCRLSVVTERKEYKKEPELRI
jgi:hypothetical protein